MTRLPPPSHPPGPRTTAALLRDRTFGPWFFGNAVSNSGNWLFNVTAAIVVFRLSNSALLVGLVSVAQFGPLLLLSPLGGALSDRVDRRRLLLAAQTVSALAASALAVTALLAGIDNLSAWPVLATAFGIGLGQAVSAPTLNALVPSLVDDVDLEGALALTSLTFNLGRALGPATAGVLLATLGAEIAFALNALSFGVLIGVLVGIRPRRPREDDSTVDRSVRAGLRYVRSEPVLLLLLAAVAATGFAADPMITLAPALAEAVGGGDSLAAGLVSAFGVAAVPAAALSSRAQRSFGSLPVATAGCGTMAGGLVVSGAAPAVWVAVAGFGLTGVGFVLALTGFTSVLQRRIPDAVRGRVMALWSVAFLGNRPIAALIDGSAADAVGPRWAMGVGVVVAGLGAFVGVRLQHRPA